MRLKRNEYYQYALKSVGSVRVNHSSSSCSGSSDSMLITTKPDSSVSAKCFRCGAVGFVPSSSFILAGSGGVSSSVVVPRYVGIPKGSKSWSEFPIKAKSWLLKSGMTEEMCSAFNIVWSDKFETLIIPINVGGKLIGVIHRGFEKHNRYRLITTDGRSCVLFATIDGNTERVVLVEDSLSAIRIKSVGVSSIALLGVELKPIIKKILIELGVKKVSVWLDNDTSSVVLKARHIAKELSWIDVEIIKGADAKYLNDAQLKYKLDIF